MALAIKFLRLLSGGEVRNCADLAQLGYVAWARITQIMNLVNLASDMREETLFLPRTVKSGDPIREQEVRPIAVDTLLEPQAQEVGGAPQGTDA